MNDQTIPSAIAVDSRFRCEQLTSSSGYRSRACEATPAIYRGRTYGQEVRAFCKRHAGIEARRRYGPTPLTYLTDAEAEAIKVRKAEEELRAAKARAEKRADDAIRHQQYVLRSLTEAARTYTATLLLEERYDGWKVEVVIHVEGEDPDRSWEAMHVEFQTERDVPATIHLRNGQTLNPSAALLLADILPVMAEWVTASDAEEVVA